MTGDQRSPLEPAVVQGLPGNWGALTATLPAGVFSATILLDFLALMAQNEQQARSYAHTAADLVTLGLSGALASTALEAVDDLNAPATATDPLTVRRLALNGAIIAVYLLDVAARRKPADDGPVDAAVRFGLSALGLALLAVSGKRR